MKLRNGDGLLETGLLEAERVPCEALRLQRAAVLGKLAPACSLFPQEPRLTLTRRMVGGCQRKRSSWAGWGQGTAATIRSPRPSCPSSLVEQKAQPEAGNSSKSV